MMVKQKEITVILNVFERLNNLSVQLNAINDQSIKPKEILIWQNKGGFEIPQKFFSKAHISCNNYNYGVWARFAFALNAKTEYVCIFDDDTIPGKKWFENCLETMEENEGLLGTRGLRFKSKTRYSPNICIGWDNPNIKTEKVDIVGHSWFFKRQWLSTFWRELPPNDFSNIAGEDIHFSYTIQKYLGLETFVPPHPPNDLDLWGSNPKLAHLLGNDNKGISSKDDSIIRFNKALKYYSSKGFKLYKENIKSMNKEIIIGDGLSSFTPLKKNLKKNKRLYKFANNLNNIFKKFGIYL